MVVSEDPTSLVLVRAEDCHTRKPWRGHTPAQVWSCDPLVLSWHTGLLTTRGVFIAVVCPMGWPMDRLFWVRDKGPRAFFQAESFRIVSRKVVVGACLA